MCVLTKMIARSVLLIFLVILPSSRQIKIEYTKIGENRSRDDEDGGKSSLAFVFDTTGSMHDDLRQLRAGAEVILSTALDEGNFIADFVFVPFHDPAVGPATVTRDIQVFKAALNAVRVYGGGDCPEKSLGGIQLALDASRPRSYMYVFTDATASDHALVGRVLDAIQRTQTQVVFVLTGHCDDLDKPSFKVYQQIAAASSGQVFNLNKTSVHKVLDFVKSSIKGRTVNLGSLVNPAGYNHTQEIPVDRTLGEVTVSVSGANPQLRVVNPSGQEVTGPPQLITALDLSEIVVVKVLDPEPGSWSITVGSEDDYSVKVVGLSNLTFNHGFSVEKPKNLEETSYRPLQGTYNYMMISLTETDAQVEVNAAEILSLDGKLLFEIPLEKVDANGKVYMARFIPPEEMFYVAIKGRDEYNTEMKRVGVTAIEAKLPEAPYLTAPTKVEAYSHERVVLKCQVESLVPVRSMWFKDGIRILEPVSSLQTTSIEYTIESVSEQDAGTYRCVAKNAAGITDAFTELVLNVNPPQVSLTSDNSTLASGRILVVCTVLSEALLLKFELMFNGTEDQYVTEIQFEPNIEAVYSFNKTIQVNERANGLYTCRASNRGGHSNASIKIDIKKPHAQILGPHTLAKHIHTDIQLVCNVENADVVQWVAPEGNVIKEYQVNGTYNAVLNIKDMAGDGTWTCVASKAAYKSTDSVEIIYLMKPEVRIEGAKNVTILYGNVYEVVCKITGKPEPRIVWHRETDRFLNNTITVMEPYKYKSTLKVNSTDGVWTATYFCIGENSEGIHEDNVTVNVRKKMTLRQGFKDLSVKLYSRVELHCVVDSYPPAQVKWYHNGTVLRAEDNENTSNYTTLYIEKVDFQHLGYYTCEADNGYESVVVNGTISVYGLASPMLAQESTKEVVRRGDSAIITCRVVKGDPEPTIRWLFKNEGSAAFTGLPLLNDQPRVELSDVRVEQAGVYRCVAENVVGKDSRDTLLVVQYPPEVAKGKSADAQEVGPRLVRAGERVELSCKAAGAPPPLLVWTKDERPVVYSSNTYLTDNNDLIIERATEHDSGLFTCNATSPLGSAHASFPLVVYIPPFILSPETEPQQAVLEGQLVELPCRAGGSPAPTVSWLQNGEPITETRKYIDEFGLRFVANLTDFGEYTCLARNQYGNTSFTFNLYIWVAPHIAPPLDARVQAAADSNVTLQCDATGFPIPTFTWEFRDLLLTRNTTNLSFNDYGNVFITNASAQHEGLYVCIAESVAGVAKKSIRFSINEPPIIIAENYTGPYIATEKDTALTIPCRVTGKPKPYVVWQKDDIYIDRDSRYDVNADGALTIIRPSTDLGGLYTCFAKNRAGATNKTMLVEIYPVPVQAEETETGVTLMEGTSASVECPARSHNDVVKWYKDAKPIAQGALFFHNVTRNNASQYACVTTNAVGSVYATVTVGVEWQPKFLSDVELYREVVKGDDTYLNCETDAKPFARTKWLFNSKPLLGRDDERLKVISAELLNTGSYKCIVNNKHGTVVRAFTLDVLEPPFISEFDVLDVQLKDGVNATLECIARGSPKPDVKWTFNNSNWQVYNASLMTTNITVQSEGLFRCDAVNKAGAAHLVYRVSVARAAVVEDVALYSGGEALSVDERSELVLGTRVRLACKAAGKPPPRVQWLRNGNVVGENLNDVYYADLKLDEVRLSDAGLYSCVASNEAGLDQRKVKLEVLEPPKIFHTLFGNTNTITARKKLEIVSGQAFYLHCHPYGNPAPQIYWFKDGLPLRLFDDTMTSTDYGEIVLSNRALATQSGNYTCVARNKVGETSMVYLVDVLIPPPTPKESSKQVDTRVGSRLNLTCPVVGSPVPNVIWIKHPYIEISEDTPRVTLLNDNITLIINATETSDSGKYSCVMTNKVGAAEYVFNVTVLKPPSIAGNVGGDIVENHVVPLKRSVVLKCDVDGHPPPKINWLKDTQQVGESTWNVQRALGDSLLSIWSASSRNGGQYICVAQSSAGVAHRRYNVRVQVPGQWSEWSPWGYCNVTCGPGYQLRSRHCHYVDEYVTIDNTTKSDKVILDESTCKGLTAEKRKCHMPPCEEVETQPRWSVWSNWSACSVSCGAGTQARTRRCKTKLKCYGDNVQIRKCPDLPKCDPVTSYAENEVFNSAEELTEANSYLPEATFEMHPEMIDQYSPEIEEFRMQPAAVPLSKPTQYFIINVTENLDYSERGPCKPGYKHNATTSACDDIDECAIENNHCHSTQICENSPGGYRCSCPAGYMSLGAGQRCLDVNECVQGLDGCEFACVNVAGGYVCACPRALRLHADRHRCVPPPLYHSPANEELVNEEYLSASINFPAKYMKVTKSTP